MTKAATLTLADFLLARIAEDEKAARDCAKVYPGEWDLYDRGHSAKVQADGPTFRIVAEFEDQDEAMAQGLVWLGDALTHIQRNSPARVLAECEAKRQLIEGFQRHVRDYRHGYTSAQPPSWVLRRLVLPYVDHPDYREEWRP